VNPALSEAIESRPPGVPVLIRAYVDLMKPHVTTLLLAITALTMVMAARGMPPLPALAATLLGGLLAAGSANAINCYVDRDIDGLMGRTMRRSLPAGRVPPRHALAFGLTLAVASFSLMASLVNLLSATLALGGILFYVLVYTMGLKRTTPQNIVIGGAAGAVPALVGWAAVTDSIGLAAFLLFCVIFFWTPPHFWALSLLIKRDYERAHIPMLPVVLGEAETRKQIFLYSLQLLGVTLLLFASGIMGYVYLAAAVILGGGMIYMAYRLLRGASLKWANRLFWYSNSYLALLFAVMALDRVIGS
jgi:protoheme IX farnesyltransferase